MSATATIPDLWPTDFGVGSEPTPSTILRQQGYILGERTKDVVYGEVEWKQEELGKFRHTLYLTAPYLKLRQPVLFVQHGLTPYPAEVAQLTQHGGEHRRQKVESSAEFMTLVRDILASPHIVQLVGSLIAQAREMDDE
jgi:hypothetical protein